MMPESIRFNNKKVKINYNHDDVPAEEKAIALCVAIAAAPVAREQAAVDAARRRMWGSIIGSISVLLNDDGLRPVLY